MDLRGGCAQAMEAPRTAKAFLMSAAPYAKRVGGSARQAPADFCATASHLVGCALFIDVPELRRDRTSSSLKLSLPGVELLRLVGAGKDKGI